MAKKLILTISFIVLSALILVSCSNKAKTPMPISESSIISSVESQSENEGTTNTEVHKSDETSKEKSVSKENEQEPSDSTKGNNKNTSTSPKKNTDKTEKETPTKTNAKSVQSSSITVKQTRKETTTKKVTTAKKQPTTQKASQCSNNNNHSMKCGNMGRWFDSKSDVKAYVDSVMKSWADKWESGEISDDEYFANCPQGYECWSCGYCGKWTGNFK